MTAKRAIVFFGIGMVAALTAGWGAFPRLLYSRQKQPLAFPHKTHAEKSGSSACSDCHSLRDDGTFTGIPKLETCAPCHGEKLGTSAAEATLVDVYVKQEREVPWLVYSRQPANARFSHAIHVRLGALPCERCHGTLGSSDELPVYEQNRISGYSRDIWGRSLSRLGRRQGEGMKMSDCEDCHREKHVEAGCGACHQ